MTATHDEGDLLALASRVVEHARPGEQVEAYVGRAHHTEVKVFDGDVESLSSASIAGVGIRVIVDHRQGFAYAGALDDDTLAETLAEARDNAGFGTPDEHLGLTGPDGVAPADLDLYRAELAEFPASAKVDLALEIDRATRAADARVRGLEAASYDDGWSESAIASTEGIAATGRRSSCSLWSVAMAGEGVDTQTGYGWSVARRPQDLDTGKAATDAAERATRLLGAIKPPSQRLTVVLDPRVTASLLGVISSALNGESVMKGRSFLAGREGEAVGVDYLTLTDSPTDPDAYGATRFDAEGLATRPVVLIEDGVLKGFLQNTYTSRRSRRPSTASAVRGGFKSAPGVGARALSLASGPQSPAELMAMVGDGLLVQGVTGLHSGTNPVSGDFSVGVEGLMIRGGAPAEPIREATIASTLPRMLLDLLAVADDREWLPGGSAGATVAIRDVTLSGT